MTSYNGYLSRVGFLEAQRQEALEVAERLEREHGEGDPMAEAVYRRARSLAEQIQEARRGKS